MTWAVKRQAQSGRRARQSALLGLVCVAINLAGCSPAAPPESVAFLETESVTVSDNAAIPARVGAGAPSLADSSWAVYRAVDDVLLFRIEFGSDGEVERLFDNSVFAKEWLGPEIIPDMVPRSTDFPGGSYVSAAYAAEHDASAGVLGVLHGLLLGAHLGTATLSFSGAVDGNRTDASMIRTVTVFADTPFPAPGDAEFEAYALRER